MKEQYILMGQRMKSRRKELKITQSQLAEDIGISNNYVSSIETGNETPSLDTFIRICNRLNVTPDYLLLGSMHSNNVSQNIIDSLRLCNEYDIEFLQSYVEKLVEKTLLDGTILISYKYEPKSYIFCRFIL